MLGQPASSQTVCSPSRRTSDFSSVYSGPVFNRVLIHSGLRSIGTWLLRTSRRSSLRPAGSTFDPAADVGTSGSLMISTVPATHDAPAAAQRGRRPDGGVSDLLVVGARGRPLLRTAAGGEGLRPARGRVGLTGGSVTLGELGVAGAHVRLRRRRVARGALGVGDGLAGIAGCAGHGVLPVAGNGAVTGRRGRPVVGLAPTEHDEDGRTQSEDGEQPRPAPRRGVGGHPALDLLGGGGRRLLEHAPLLA